MLCNLYNVLLIARLSAILSMPVYTNRVRKIDCTNRFRKLTSSNDQFRYRQKGVLPIVGQFDLVPEDL